MELEFSGVAVAEESGDEELSNDCSLEGVVALVGDGGDGVGLGFEAHWEGVSRGLKPLVSLWPVLPGLKSGPISEANATTTTSTTAKASAGAKASTSACAEANAAVEGKRNGEAVQVQTQTQRQ